MGWINATVGVVKLSVVAVASYFATNSLEELPNVEQSRSYYSVDAGNIEGLQDQLVSRGPNGYFAFTRWNVTWSPSCQVWVSVLYEFPRHENADIMPPEVLRRWQNMLSALLDHEDRHGRNGINAGREIMQSNCENPREILLKWNEEDRLFDLRTAHGKNQGATLGQ